MRVISGELKGRKILGHDISGTRPTMDRVKESVFAMIQDYIDGKIVLDLFAGSGNLGIESLSNGSRLVYFNDNNKKCISIIKENLLNFNLLNRSVITNMDYREALRYYKEKNIKYDVVFLDPPYKNHVISDVLLYLVDNKLLNKNGIVICEMDSEEVFINDKLMLFKAKKYGDKKVMIYKINN